MARPAGDLWSAHHLLQSLRSVADALAAGHNAAVQMIDTSVVRVHQHGACFSDNNHQDMGRSRGGLTSKIPAVVDGNGLPVHLALTPREVHDNRLCSVLLSALLPTGKFPDPVRVVAAIREQHRFYLAFVKLASIRIWLRANKSTP
jgi:hypothetical protein